MLELLWFFAMLGPAIYIAIRRPRLSPLALSVLFLIVVLILALPRPEDADWLRWRMIGLGAPFGALLTHFFIAPQMDSSERG